MKLDEAIKSGRPFRRKSSLASKEWIENPYDPITRKFSGTERLTIPYFAAISDDWEVKPEEPTRDKRLRRLELALAELFSLSYLAYVNGMGPPYPRTPVELDPDMFGHLMQTVKELEEEARHNG